MALTTKYITPAGAGAHTGVDAANAYTLAEGLAAATAGTRLLALGGSFSIGSLTSANSGTATSPIILEAAVAAVGDLLPGGANYSRALGGTNALATTGRATITLDAEAALTLLNFWIFAGFNVVCNTDGTPILLGTNGLALTNIVTNSSTGAVNGPGCIVAGTNGRVIDNDVACAASVTAGGSLIAATSNTTAIRVIGNRIIGDSTSKLSAGIFCGGASEIEKNVIARCAKGINITSTAAVLSIHQNTIAFNTTGITLPSGMTSLQDVIGNMITDNTTTGLECGSTATAVSLQYNRLVRNGTAIANGGDWVTATQQGNNTTAGNDYVAPTTNDFRLLLTSPANTGGQFGGGVGSYSPMAYTNGGRLGIGL